MRVPVKTQEGAQLLTGGDAVANAMAQIDPDVFPVYPITPQTPIIQTFAKLVANGKASTEIVNVESEHSAMSATIGSALAGARSMTATSSQGLALMAEVVYIAAGMRAPIVMAVGNRALSAPLNIHCDHSDIMGARDTGWIQYYCADAQDVLDAILIAYDVAEQALLPVMINMDAFYLTHTSEVLDVPDQETVDIFLPPYQPASKLDVNDPKTFGNVCGADLYTSIKYKRHCDTLSLESLWNQTAVKFSGHFDRLHLSVEGYRTEDADVCIIGIGSATGAMRMAVDRLRGEGLKVGTLRLAMIRPFPLEAVKEATANATHIIIIDRDVSFGAEGIVAQEVKAGLFGRRGDVKATGFVAGVGGNDITVDTIIPLVRQGISGDGSAVGAGMSLWAEVLP